MQYKNYKKYLKRIIDLQKIIDEEDVEFANQIDNSFDGLLQIARDEEFKVPIVYLQFRELKNELEDNIIDDMWDSLNKLKYGTCMELNYQAMGVQGRLYDWMRGKDTASLEQRYQEILNNYPTLKRLHIEQDSIMYSYYWRFGINFSFNLKAYDGDLDELVLDMKTYARELIEESRRWVAEQQQEVA